MACVVTNTSEFKALLKAYNVSKNDMEIAIKTFLDKNNLEEYNPQDKNFSDYLDSYFQIKSSNEYSSKEDLNNALKVWEKYDQLFKETENLNEYLNDPSFLNTLESFFEKENYVIYNDLNGNTKIKIGKPFQKVSSSSIKEGVPELFESNPELSSIGTPEQYSKYLDTIFPESKVKDIVTHFSKNEFEKFDKNRQITGTLGKAFYFYPYISTKTDIDYEKKHGNNARFSLLNIKKLGIATDVKASTIQPLLDNNDGVKLNNIEIVVFEPEQIHILGSKKDVEGFKEFVSNENNAPKGTINVYWGQGESESSTRILSNLAPRKFNYKSTDGITREYGSVEHAYQSNKSGSFDQDTYNAYNRIQSMEFESQDTSISIEIKGESGKEFLLTRNRNSAQYVLWSEKKEDGSYTTSLDTPTKAQVENLAVKYIPVETRKAIDKWVELHQDVNWMTNPELTNLEKMLKEELFPAKDGYGRKIAPKVSVAEMKTADSLGLMKKLVVESFKQNSNSEAAKKLLQYENFTHNTNQLIDKAFLEGLKLAQKELRDDKPTQTVKPLKTEFLKLDELVNKIIEDSKKNIVFNEEEHSYTVNGVKADFSVTGFLYGDLNIGDWGLPSSKLGTTVDTIVRDYFSGNLKKIYPNLKKNSLNNLISDLDKLKKYFDNKFGENEYKVETKEFPIASKILLTDKEGNTQEKLIAGTMDMLVYDSKGNVYIYDVKTSRSGIKNNKKTDYANQISLYRSILETEYPELKGRFKEGNVIEFKVWYPDPEHVTYTSKDLQLYIDGQLSENVLNENDFPRLTIQQDGDYLLKLNDPTVNESFKKLNEEEKELIEETFGEIKTFVPENFEQTEEEKQRENLNNPYIIPFDERSFLANSAMIMFSNIVTHLQQSESKRDYYFPNGEYKNTDFTKMSRMEIIDLIGINKILNVVKEYSFNIKKNKAITNIRTLKKLKHAYDNWNALVEVGKNKLITLEGISIKRSNLDKSEVVLDMGDDNTVTNENETLELEDKPREYWLIGLRLISAQSGLSSEIRRSFEKLPVLDKNGEQQYDEYGYGFPLYVDGSAATNSILDWVKNVTTMEEMDTILQNMSESFSWVNSIIDKVKEEPFRSKFFNNFRKDFTKYSILSLDVDSNGKRTYTVQVINTKGVSETILNEVVTAFKEGIMSNIIEVNENSIDGKGKVNVEGVTKLKNRFDILKNKFLLSSKSNVNLGDVLEESAVEITKLLNDLGIQITFDTINTFLKKDMLKKRYMQTSLNNVMLNIENILNTILKLENEELYSPFDKGNTLGNVYSNYKNIIEKFSKYIQDSIESSTYENGKMYYSFTIPSYLLKTIKKLNNSAQDIESFEEFMEKNYGKYKWFKTEGEWNNTWLKLISENKSIRSELDHKVMLSFEVSDNKKTTYKEMTGLDYSLAMINEFFYDSHKNWAWYRVPIMSDKPSAEFIKFKRFNVDYKKEISKGLKDVLNQEIMRIQTTIERAKLMLEGKLNIEPIKNFDIIDIVRKNDNLKNKILEGKPLTASDLKLLKGSGGEFKFLEMFNSNVADNDEIGKLIINKINDVNPIKNEVDLAKSFDKVLQGYMNRLFLLEKDRWRAMGLYKTEQIEDPKKGTYEIYKYLNNLGSTNEEVDSNLEEFFWNDMFAAINIIQLTVTDLAYYKNLEDFQKRYAQVHSPTMKMNTTAIDENGERYSKDGLERTIYLKDFEIVSEITPQIKTVLYNKVALGLMTKYQADTILAKFGYSNTPDGKFVKTTLENGKEVFLKSEKINVADAQGYSSPTSYRKKMGMLGKWDSTMQAAYEKIKSGNWNGEDLNVVWQPLKPFVYSQISKISGSDVMDELKVPVQNKNSEYLLILADAILKGSDQPNKLSAIYDFMEETAFTGGKYNGIGIDTVLFESAVKSGLMGVIDINEASTKEEVFEILLDNVYHDHELKIYNNQRVHEIPYEDYGIQQEVPNHLLDHEQLQGSQMRILSIADITSNEIFKVGDKVLNSSEIINDYQKLIADNIKDSFDKLEKQFKFKGTRFEKNKALSDLLIKQVTNESKYDVDLITALTLKNGEFIIPLSDPIQSTRIQQLLNSIIKKEINKLKVSGGPVVQASAFGLSEELSIVWLDKNGNIMMSKSEYEAQNYDESYQDYLDNNLASVAYFETFMPIPSTAMEKALTKKDGSLMSIEEALAKGIIVEEQLKTIGYRIPTEDKYSMAPLRVKGFLPKSAGEAIILPKEITLLSGSDFDIDKMYVIVKDFTIKTDYTFIKNQITKYLKSKNLSPVEINNYIEGNEATGESSLFEYLRKIEAGVIFGTDKTSSEEYVEDEKGLQIYDFYQANKDKLKNIVEEKIDLNTREGRNNKIFDYQYAILTHPDTMSKMFNPGSFDVLKKTARIINILKDSNHNFTFELLFEKTLDELTELENKDTNRSIITSSTQVYLHQQNMIAGKMIGIFANNNTSHAFINLLNIDISLQPFIFDGISIDAFQKLDPTIAFDGKTLISKNIAGFLAASVDAVKDPVLNFLNLNTTTSGVAMLLSRLGFDVDSIGLFLSQPIIEKAISEYNILSNEEYVDLESFIKTEIEKLQTKYKANEKDLSSNPFTKAEMANQIALKAKGIISQESISYQAQVLMLFGQLHKSALNLNQLTFITKFNSVTNAVGPNISDNIILELKVMKFFENLNSDFPNFSESAEAVFTNSPILNAFYNAATNASNRIFEDYFPHYSVQFTRALELFQQGNKSNIDNKIIDKLLNEFILYGMTAGENPIFDTSEEKRSYYMNAYYKDSDGNYKKGFITIFKELIKGVIKNDLIDAIQIKPPTDKCPVATLEIKTGNYNVNTLEKIKNAWSNLIINPETRQFGIDLFYYNMMRNGFAFSPKTFIHLASVFTKYQIPGYIDTLRTSMYSNNNLNINDFVTKFKINHANQGGIVPNVKPPKTMRVELERNFYGNDVATFSLKNDSDYLLFTGKDSKFANVIKYNKKLWILKKVNDENVQYINVESFGINNNFLEYNANEDLFDTKSAINNRATVFDYETSFYNENILNEVYPDIEKEELSNIKNSLKTILNSEDVQQLENTNLETDKYKSVMKDILNQKLSEQQTNDAMLKINKVIEKLC